MAKKKQAVKEYRKADWRVVAIGLICLSVIECFALMNGINGTLMTIVIGVIALAIGVTLPSPIKQE